MRRVLPKLAVVGAGLLLLAGCTQTNTTTQPTDGASSSANPTVPVTPVTPTTAPVALAAFTYASGSANPKGAFTVPAGGFALTVTCKTATDGQKASLHYVANTTFSGDYGFACDGGNQYQVMSKADVKAAGIAGKKITFTVNAASLKQLTALTFRATRN